MMEGTGKRMIRPCFFTDEVAEDFEESVRRGTEAGAKGLEIRGHLFGQSIQDIDNDNVKRIQEVAAKYDVTVAVLASPFGKCGRNRAEIEAHWRIFDRMLELTQAFGTPLIRGFPFWNPHRDERDRPNLDEYLDEIVAFLEPVVQKAEDAGALLCLETEGATLSGTCAEVRQIIDALGNSPALRVTWDANNAWHCGEEPLPDGYDQVRGLVRHVHVKPNAAKTLATVGGSQTSYEQVLRTLLADGYDGWASIEHWGSPEEMLSGIRQLTGLLEEIQ